MKLMLDSEPEEQKKEQKKDPKKEPEPLKPWVMLLIFAGIAVTAALICAVIWQFTHKTQEGGGDSSGQFAAGATPSPGEGEDEAGEGESGSPSQDSDFGANSESSSDAESDGSSDPEELGQDSQGSQSSQGGQDSQGSQSSQGGQDSQGSQSSQGGQDAQGSQSSQGSQVSQGGQNSSGQSSSGEQPENEAAGGSALGQGQADSSSENGAQGNPEGEGNSQEGSSDNSSSGTSQGDSSGNASQGNSSQGNGSQGNSSQGNNSQGNGSNNQSPQGNSGQTGITMTFEPMEDSVTPKEVVNLRSAPTTQDSGNIITQAKNGEVLSRTGINQETGWSKLEYQGQTLYAVTSNLTTDLNYTPPVQAEDPNQFTTAEGRVVVFQNCDNWVTAKEYANLRTEPSTSQGEASVVCQLKLGDRAHRTGCSEDTGWSRVEYNGQVLYVVSSLVLEVNMETEVRE